ncbi:MAG: bile acid:sodium symporter family protein, partial [Myxococcales bacterium]|nr:bile acid:sodium symporter family protein [Myxococcales bacterium]
PRAAAAAFERLFPLWVLALSGAAIARPDLFVPLRPQIPWLLGLIMTGMGMTLRASDLRAVASAPRAVALGVAAQYGVMPVLAYAISRALDLPPALAAGLVLVGACPGGTASNVVTYLAGGDVAFSVAMTLVSTAIAPVLTPLLASALAGRYVPVEAADLFVGTAKIVVLPLVAGFAARRWFPGAVTRLLPALPSISIAAILAIIACVVALNAGTLSEVGPIVLVAVALHNLGGLAAGWGLGSLAGLARPRRIALAIEVGMQNSGLAAALAVQFFPAGAALPGAIFSAWHNLSGSLLASWFARGKKTADAPAGS